jgi:hypothetical protein
MVFRTGLVDRIINDLGGRWERYGDSAVIPHGAIPHGATPHGANPHGAIPHGAIPYGSILLH